MNVWKQVTVVFIGVGQLYELDLILFYLLDLHVEVILLLILIYSINILFENRNSVYYKQ